MVNEFEFMEDIMNMNKSDISSSPPQLRVFCSVLKFEK